MKRLEGESDWMAATVTREHLWEHATAVFGHADARTMAHLSAAAAAAEKEASPDWNRVLRLRSAEVELRRLPEVQSPPPL